MNRFNFKISDKRGVAALPLIMMIGGLISGIIIALLVSNFLLSQSELGFRASASAFLAAQSGYQDAFLRIIRNKEYSGSYTMNFSDGTAEVTVCADSLSPVCVGFNKSRITVLGTSQNRHRKFEAVLDVSQETGKATLETLTEVPL